MKRMRGIIRLLRQLASRSNTWIACAQAIKPQANNPPRDVKLYGMDCPWNPDIDLVKLLGTFRQMYNGGSVNFMGCYAAIPRA
jgi:hypothetical protein